MAPEFNVHRRWIIASLCMLWALMQLALYLKFGFQDGGDSPRYFGAAESILNGNLPAGKARSYLGYDVFVAVITSMGLGRSAIGAVQVLLSGLATILLFRTGEILYDQRVGFSAAILYVLFPDVHYWNFVIYTESLFCSMVITSLYLLVTADSGRRFLIAVCVALFTCTIRPHGVGFGLAVSAYLLLRLYRSGNKLILGYTLASLLLASPFVWMAAGHMVKFETVIQHYGDGTVIWGYKNGTLSMPGEVTDAVDDHAHPVIQVLTFAFDKPDYFFTLFYSKIYYFFMHIRPYFATYHNLISLLFLLPVYLFAICGVIAAPTRRRVDKVLLVGVIMFQTLIVSLTFADWDGRHLIPILSVIFLLAGSGFWLAWDRLQFRGFAAPDNN